MNQVTPLVSHDNKDILCDLNDALCFEYKTQHGVQFLSIDKPINLDVNDFVKEDQEYILN